MDVFCVGLVFSRSDLRYQSYARQYVEALLRLQKNVAIFSPDWILLNQYFQINFRDQSKRIHCFALSASTDLDSHSSKFSFLIKHLAFRRVFKNAERRMGLKIDFLFFAPVDDWIRPAFPKYWLNRILTCPWSGLLLNMTGYGQINNLAEPSKLPLNVDPVFKEPDYLLSVEKCMAVCTLDRFRSEQLKSRVYKKVIVMPDISDYDLPKETPNWIAQIKRMAHGRMIVGTVLLEGDKPEEFIRLMHDAAKEHYFFICVGIIDSKKLSKEGIERLNNLLSSGKNNFYFILDAIEEYEQMNAIINAFDVCFISPGEMNLPHGIISKAAYFKKPLLGILGEMSGWLIASFKLGICLELGSEEGLQALHTFRLQMPLYQNFDSSSAQNYAQLQNQTHLREAWEMLLWV